MDREKLRARAKLRALGIYTDNWPLPPRSRLLLPIPDTETPTMYVECVKSLMDDFVTLSSFKTVDPFRLRLFMHLSVKWTEREIASAALAQVPVVYKPRWRPTDMT